MFGKKIDERTLKLGRYAKINEDLYLKIFNDDYLISKLAEAAAVVSCRAIDEDDDIDELIEMTEATLEDEEAILEVRGEIINTMLRMFGL